MAVPIDFAKIEARLLAAMSSSRILFHPRGTGKSFAHSMMYGTKTGRWGSGNSFYLSPRSKPMFTKQHYEAVATLLSGMREFIREGGAPLDVRAEQMQIVNEMTVRFSAMFKRDSKKFKDLLFIGACDAGTSTEPRKE